MLFVVIVVVVVVACLLDVGAVAVAVVCCSFVYGGYALTSVFGVRVVCCCSLRVAFWRAVSRHL